MGQAKNILITGAGGFLGKRLAEALAGTSHKILLYTTQKDRVSSFAFQKIDGIYDQTDWMSGQIPFEETDLIMNCAFARSSDGEKIADSVRFIDEFLSYAVRKGTKSVINISSQSVYDQKRAESATEKTQVKPESIYGMAKYLSELLTARICTGFGVPFSNIRLGSLAGKEFGVRLTNRFVKSALSGEPVNIKGGQQIISYLHIEDAVSALQAMANTEPSNWHPIYNLGAADQMLLKDIAALVQETAGDYQLKPVVVNHTQSDDFLNLTLDSARFCKDMEWMPVHSMADLIRELFAYYTDQNQQDSI